MESPTSVMMRHLTEFTQAERRFRRLRCILLAFFGCLTFAMVVYLLLSWEAADTDDGDDDDAHEKDSSSFVIISVVSVVTLTSTCALSFVLLEVIRRRSMRHLTSHQSEVMRSYYAGHGSLFEQGNILPTARTISTNSSWAGHPPPSEVSAPPPAYDECVEMGDLKLR